MTMKNTILFFVSLLIFVSISFSVVGLSSFDTYGNEANNFGSGNLYLLFSSNYPNGTIYMSENTISTTNTYQPLVIRPNLNETDNLIFTFSNNAIIVYDKNLEVLDTYTFTTANIAGSSCTLDIEGDSIIDIIVPVDDGGDLEYRIMKYTSSGLIESDTIDIPDSVSPDAVCNILNPIPLVYTYNQTPDGIDIFAYDLELKIMYNSYIIPDGIILNDCVKAEIPYYNHPLSIGNIDYDNAYEIIMVYQNSAKSFVSYNMTVFDTVTGDVEIDNVGIVEYGSIDKWCNRVAVSPVQIGQDSSLKEIAIMLQPATSLETSMIAVYDSTGVQKYFRDDSSTDVISNIVVGDIDANGYNDFCFKLKDRFRCINHNYNNILALPITSYNIGNYISMSDFIHDNDYAEVVTADGIISFNDTSIISLNKNFSVLYDPDYITIPVSVMSRSSFSKDIVMFKDDSLTIISNYSDVTVCGDGICEGSETMLSCYVDCNPYIEPVIELNGSDVNEPCTENADCKSNLCEYGICTLRTEGLSCIDDTQCLSGSCNEGKCTKPTYWNKIEASKNQQFGDDSKTNLFIAITLTLFLTGTIIYLTRSVVGVIIGVIVFMTSVIFFTIVGWLSAWILFSLLFFFIFMMFVGWVLLKGNE